MLVVCHGNICRSPLAGAILAERLGHSAVRDRGLGGRTGLLAAKRVRDYAAELGVDLSQHRSRSVTAEDLAWADLIIYMDGGNLRRLKSMTERPCVCLGSYVGVSRIPDPNYLSGRDLQQALNLLYQASASAAEQIR